MKCNMGTVDRYIRVSIGMAFALYAIINFDIIIAIPSVVIAYTVATRWCILYHFLGINTGCHLQEGNTAGAGRNNIIEGLFTSFVAFLLLLIVYLVIKYINT